MRRHTVAAVRGLGLGVLIAALVAGAALAASNSPSTAFQLKLGVPYSSTIDRSKAATEWLKLPSYMRPGDTLTFAAESSDSSIRFCLVPAVDDFAQKDTQARCDGPGYTSAFAHADIDQGKYRRTLDWEMEAGDGFLLVQPGCGACGRKIWTYSITVEQVITRVNIGMPALEHSPRKVSIVAATTLGDNSSAPDGIPGRLLWRMSDDAPFQPLSTATTSGGRLALNGTLPPYASGKTIELSACVDQIGGGEPRCSGHQVKIDPDPLPTVAASRVKLSSTRSLTVPLVCAQALAPENCVGIIEIRTSRAVQVGTSRRKVRLARQEFSIPPGATTRVVVRLGKRQARLLQSDARARRVATIIRLDEQPGKRMTTLRVRR